MNLMNWNIEGQLVVCKENLADILRKTFYLMYSFS